MTLQKCLILLAALTLSAPAWAQHGALTIPRNLDQLTDRAAVIVRGNVVSARVEKHPELTGLHTVVVTIRVRETLKGPAQGTFTFRQYIWDIRDLHDAAGYRKGDDMLLLMIAPSRHGLSSPAGADQGRFRIQRDSTGREMAVNGQGNFQLFEDMGMQFARKGVALSPRSTRLLETHRRGAVEISELTGLIRELADVAR